MIGLKFVVTLQKPNNINENFEFGFEITKNRYFAHDGYVRFGIKYFGDISINNVMSLLCRIHLFCYEANIECYEMKTFNKLIGNTLFWRPRSMKLSLINNNIYKSITFGCDIQIL